MSDEYRNRVAAINRAIEKDDLIIFVGAGVSMNSGYPSWDSLINELKESFNQFDLPKTEDKLEIAESISNQAGKNEFLTQIRQIFESIRVKDNPILDKLVNIHPKHIITTNYDSLIEDKLKYEIDKYDLVRTDSDLPYVGDEHLIIKMHGDLDLKNIVLTKTDYSDYGENFGGISSKIRSLITNHTVLFLGYSLHDETFNTIFRTVQDLFGKDAKRAYLYVPEFLNSDQITEYENRSIYAFTNSKNVDDTTDKGELTVDFLSDLKIHPDFSNTEMSNTTNSIKDLWAHLSFFKDFSFIESRMIAEYSGLVPKALIFYPDSFRWLDQDKKLFNINDGASSTNEQTELYNLIQNKTYFNRFLDYERQGDEFEPIRPYTELESAYELYLKNEYSQARIAFRNVANEAFKKRDYLTYLIAEFNINHLNSDNGVELPSSVSNKSLSSVIEDLISSSSNNRAAQLGIFFKHQVNNFQFISKKTFIISELSRDIKKEWKNSKDGGRSFNSNLSLLKFEFNSFVTFIKANKLTVFHFKEVQNIIDTYFETLLIALAIGEEDAKKNDFFAGASSKLDMLNMENIQDIIPYVDFDNVRATMDNFRLTQINVDNKTILDIVNQMLKLPEIHSDPKILDFKMRPFINLLELANFSNPDILLNILKIYPLSPTNINYHKKLLEMITKKLESTDFDLEAFKSFLSHRLSEYFKNDTLAEFHAGSVPFYNYVFKCIRKVDDTFEIDMFEIHSKLDVIIDQDNIKNIHKSSDLLIGLFYYFSESIQSKIKTILRKYESVSLDIINYDFVIEVISNEIYSFESLKPKILNHFSKIMNEADNGVIFYPDPKRRVVGQAYDLIKTGFITRSDLVAEGIFDQLKGYYADIDWELFGDRSAKTISELVKSYSFSDAKERYAKNVEEKELFDSWAVEQFVNGVKIEI